MSPTSLEDLLQTVGNAVDLLRGSQTGPYVYPVVPPEYSNWRDEQRAWQQTCVLFNQSYHMTDMYVQGPDTLCAEGHSRHCQPRALFGSCAHTVRRGLAHRS